DLIVTGVQTCALPISATMAMALLGLAGIAGSALAQGSKWQADHDAGWKAFQDGRLADAEKLLRSAQREARGFAQNDPRLATTVEIGRASCRERGYDRE